MKRKLTAVLLCVAIIVSVTPVVAAQSTVNDITQNIIDKNVVQAASEPYIVGEITEKRTEDTKHFLMSGRERQRKTGEERQGTVLCLDKLNSK